MARRLLLFSFLVIFFIITFTDSLPVEENSIFLKRETSNALIKKRQTPAAPAAPTAPTAPAPGDQYVLYANFEEFPYFEDEEKPEYVTGFITLAKLNDGSVRIYGQCNTGFIEPNPAYYEIWIAPTPLCPPYRKRFDLTPFLKYSINVPGTSAFQFDFTQFTLEECFHQWFVVKLFGRTIGAGFIKGTEES